jgi:hypothetical protein
MILGNMPADPCQFYYPPAERGNVRGKFGKKTNAIRNREGEGGLNQIGFSGLPTEAAARVTKLLL